MAPSPEGVASPHNQVGSSPEGNGTLPFTHAGGNPYRPRQDSNMRPCLGGFKCSSLLTSSMAIPPQLQVTQNQNVANTVNDPLYISSSDHPGMMLTNTPFNGSNFHGWSRNVKMALGAKLKLGFIDGSCNKPSADNVDEQRWIRCDYMVTCWIFNSMVAELSDAFLYAQIKSDNSSKIRECTCAVIKKFVEKDSNSKLIQFLMKLSDGYESMRSQILAMDPLPNWYKGKKAKKFIKLAAHVNSGFEEHFHGDTPFDMVNENEVAYGQSGGVDQKLVAAVLSRNDKNFQRKECHGRQDLCKKT
ncbi:sulfotransferase 16 [Tanacetum coccineum]